MSWFQKLATPFHIDTTYQFSSQARAEERRTSSRLSILPLAVRGRRVTDGGVGAAVVLAEGASVDADALRAFVKEGIAAFKAPRYIWFMDSALPRKASGKFLKPELRKSLDVADAR